MTRQIWDPYKTLNLNQDGEGTLCCVGRSVSQWKTRCPYRIAEADLVQIRMMINNMTAFSPNESTIALSKLAKLCLCPSIHQDQKVEVVAKWKRQVAEEARNYEDSQKLRTENLRLIGKLAAERHERGRLESLVQLSLNEPVHLALSDSPGNSLVLIDSLSEPLDEDSNNALKQRLIATLHEATTNEQQLQEAEAYSASLKERIHHLESAYADRVRDIDELQTFLNYQKAEFTAELAEERESAREYQQVLKQGKEAVESLQDTQDKLFEALQADIADKTVVLKRYSVDLAEKSARNLALVKKIDKLTAQLNSESRNTKQLKEDLERSGDSENNLVARVSTLEARLATELRKSEKLRKDIIAAQEAENESIRQLEHYHARFLNEKDALSRTKQALQEETQRRTQLAIEIEELRTIARENIMTAKRNTHVENLTTQEDSDSENDDDNNRHDGGANASSAPWRRRDSVNSEASCERRRSIRLRKLSLGPAIDTTLRTDTMLLEEIISLRQQLLTTREAHSTLAAQLDQLQRQLDNTDPETTRANKTRLEVNTHAASWFENPHPSAAATENPDDAHLPASKAATARIEALEQQNLTLRSRLETQETITSKLDEILTINSERAKEREERLKLHLESVQIALRQAQMDLGNANARNAFLVEVQNGHLREIADLEGQIEGRTGGGRGLAGRNLGKKFGEWWKSLSKTVMGVWNS